LSDRPAPFDLEPGELELHQLLAGVPPQALPVGFRDLVMSRLGSRRVVWELIVALLFAVPSVAFLARQVLVHGDDFMAAIGNVMTAASSETTDAFFFVDGLTVIALALLGIACAFAAHALLVGAGGAGGRTVAR
jgi:hypothetical protein